MQVFTGNANRPFAEDICRHLGLALGQAEVFEFSNENIFVKVKESVRGQDVYVVQSLGSPLSRSIMEVLIMMDALRRASAGRITAVLPYYAYGRTDKKDQPRVPITARLLADLLTTAGADRLLTMDLHAGQIQGFFNIPVDELQAVPILAEYYRRWRLVDGVVVAPDLGAAKRGRALAQLLGLPLAIIEKRRTEDGTRTEPLRVIGDVRDKTAIIVDDEIDTASSVVGAAQALVEAGARDVCACCTHAVFSGPAIDRIRSSSIREIVVTDTLPLAPHKRIDKVRVLSVAPLFAETMRRIHQGASVGELFG